MRKLITVRTVDNILPIPNADAIEVAVIGGWDVVVKKGEFKPGDRVFYAEIDSFLPDGNPAWQFLVDKQPREFNGMRGHRLRTVTLRGQDSQGFIIPLSALPQITNPQEDVDYADALGVVKYDPPVPAQLSGQVEGFFPSFLPKTDEKRCQNLVSEIFAYDDTKVLIDGLSPASADQEALAKGTLFVEEDKVYFKRPAKANRDAKYEVTMKLDGSSCTIFHNNGEIGVCSRNLQLKINDENKDNTFVRILFDTCLNVDLPRMGNFAVQGELMGPGIQDNHERLTQHQLFIFNVFDIDKGKYLTPVERWAFVDRLANMSGNGCGRLWHVPVLTPDLQWTTSQNEAGLFTMDELNIRDVKQLLAFAEGPSLNPNNSIREGVVFKRADGKFSFKAISNKFLKKVEK